MGTVFRYAFWLLAGIYFVLFGFNSLVRVHSFPNDPMNYVDVARNIAAGNGAVQSTLGFNQQLFSAGDPIPTPLTSQPILFPALLALPGVLGLPIDMAALILSTMCYAATVLLLYMVADRMYSRNLAVLLAGLLLLYYPLRLVMRSAFSETIGIVLVLASLTLLDRYLSQQRPATWVLAAGLCGGLAFASRYAFVIVLLSAGLFILLKQRRAGLRTLALYALGSCIPIIVTIARNIVLLGALLPTPPDSTRASLTVVSDAIKSLLGQYTDVPSPNFAAAIVVLATLGLAALALRRRELGSSLRGVLIEDNRGLLTLWALAYLAFMVYQRSRYHFDPLNARLLMPAGVIVVLLWAAFALRVLRWELPTLQWVALALATLACGRELWLLGSAQAYSQEQFIARSERLTWIERNTDQQDLIIGDETVDIPFYLRRPVAVSFAHFPYNEHLEYAAMMQFVERHCGDYRSTFLVISDRYTQPDEWQRNYGPFISDLVAGRAEPYPAIRLEQRLDDAFVFRINCST